MPNRTAAKIVPQDRAKMAKPGKPLRGKAVFILAAPKGEIANPIMSNLRQTDSFFSCRSTNGITMNWAKRGPRTGDYPGGGVAMNISQTIAAHVTREFNASPQHVFASWMDSKIARKWLFSTTGEIVCAEIDGRAGGWFYIVEHRNGENVEYVGEYLEVVQPHRLIFMLLADKYSLNFERVTALFKAREIGCEVSLVHETRAERVEQMRRTWIQLFYKLAESLSDNVPIGLPLSNMR
jgi:uncharacterized protein YndB with AHSA1/START domain